MRLRSDNPELMPITDAVYGEAPTGKSNDYEPRGHFVKLWRRLTLRELDSVATDFPKARRFAARRRQEVVTPKGGVT